MIKKSRTLIFIKRISDAISVPKCRRDRQREEQQKELNITFGEQDALDILSYASTACTCARYLFLDIHL